MIYWLFVETMGGELANALRSAAFEKDNRQSILAVADQIESVVSSLNKQLEDYHGRLADEMNKLRVSELKYSAILEELRLEKARRFGKSSEQWKTDEKQLALVFNEIEMSLKASGEAEENTVLSTLATEHTTMYRRRKSTEETTRGRKPLPANLPRHDTLVDIPEAEKICAECGRTMVRVGEEVSERLCIEPVKFFVERTIRPKYGCSCGCGGMHTAPVSEQIIPKSIASPSVLAVILASKFCDALPFYRQERILSREGIDLSRATMARWALAAHMLLEPLTKLIRAIIRGSPVMHLDETRVRVLHENGTAKEGLSWMWCSAATIELPEPAGSRTSLRLISFYYAPGRDMEVAAELLKGFTGVLMTDAYTAYDTPSHNAGIIQAACMAHVRRKFHDVLKIESKNPSARIAMEFILALYAVEREYAEAPPDERKKARQKFSRPIMDKFWEWLVATGQAVVPQSTLGKAIAYTIPLWPRLKVFLDDGRVPIDNNIAENSIRPFAVGRRNWLFFDQSEGAEASTSLVTILETARANDVEPMHYLQFLFNCIEHFGLDAMPWEKLLPTPTLPQFAESLGISYAMGL